jgi:hypothetical protein
MSDTPEPTLIEYLTTSSVAVRDAAFLEMYARRLLDGTAATWEIPNTVASTIRDIARRIREREP